jgi:flavin reductase (DIM6/NTAB) family NADH-FMN oxidoreductase RutF
VVAVEAGALRQKPLCDDRCVATTLDGQGLRRVMSRWATGVAVVTSRADDGPRGATTNALTSLSLDPLLVLVCLDRTSNTLEAVRASGRFCVNVLAADQEELARRFATKQSGEEKLAGVPHEPFDGVPVLAGAVAWLVCELERELDGGDHTILIGRPLETGVDPHAEPLVFYGGRYHAASLGLHER